VTDMAGKKSNGLKRKAMEFANGKSIFNDKWIILRDSYLAGANDIIDKAESWLKMFVGKHGFLSDDEIKDFRNSMLD